MKTRTQRLLAIRRIIGREAVSSQEELLRKLDRAGFELTQATLSRDLKFLQAGKRPDKEKGYVYYLPANNAEPLSPAGDGNVSANGFLSMDWAWNLALIKTLPGFASGIASTIDGLGAYEILGTVAGDDTILLIPRQGISREDVINALAVILPVE
jgi:transcriptional regulator of arginine metabolism